MSVASLKAGGVVNVAVCVEVASASMQLTDEQAKAQREREELYGEGSSSGRRMVEEECCLQSRRHSSRSQQPLRRCRQDWRSRPREAEGVAAVRAAKAVAAAKVEEKEGEGEGDSSKLRLSPLVSL